MSNNHIIHKLNFDIKGFSSNSEYHHFANRIGAIVRSSLDSKLDRLFNQYSTEGYHIVVNLIEIDVGYINLRNLENNLLVKVEKFLERQLINIKSKVDYQIKHGLNTYQGLVEQNQNQFELYQKLHLTTNKSESQISSIASSISGEIINIIPNRLPNQNVVVLPSEVQYQEAILHYLEYGWLPRHLHIPQEEFHKIFSAYIFQNHDYVLKYFGRKPDRTKKNAIQRLESQISQLPKEILIKGEGRTSLNKIAKEIHKEKFRLVAKAVRRLPDQSDKLTKEDKQLIEEVFSSQFFSYSEINKLSELIDDNEEYQKYSSLNEFSNYSEELNSLIDKSSLSNSQKKKLKKLEENVDKTVEQSDKNTSFIPFPPSAKELFKERISILLDSNDKSTFKKLLESKFYKSITKSYVDTYDSVETISRAFISLVLNPTKREEIFASIPDYIDSEREFINQLYRKNPILIVESLKLLSKFEHSEIKLRTYLASFIGKLQKKHVVLIMKSLMTNYTKLAPILTFINSQFKNLRLDSISSEIRELKEKKISEAHIISEYFSTGKPVQKIIEEYLDISFIALSQQAEKDVKTAIKAIIDRSTLALPLISERSFSKYDKSYQIGLNNEILGQFQSIKIDAVERFNILLQEFHIPSNKKNLAPDNISNLISDLKKEEQKQLNKGTINDPNDITSKVEDFQKNIISSKPNSDRLKQLKENKEKLQASSILPESFVPDKILKNKILRQLTKKEFSDILEITLPTTSYRKFLELFDKYKFLWKTGIDEKQIQIIFLSLVKYHKEVNEHNIFKLFFNHLKKYKAWTNEFLKKRVIERFEAHRDYLVENERALVINYIDQIDTLEGVAFKDTRKKLEGGIPVKNAGLVLLWPFMKTLFQLTKLIDAKGEFKNLESRERATLLLQYLAVKTSTVEEPYLALNKIMTGFPLEDSITSEIILTEKEKDISNALLANVIKQWPNFTNSSIDNLRGSFIIRDGILSFKNNQWVLHVEAKAYDLLLSKLPWGYSMIRLSWIPYIIKVEWN